MSAEDWRRVRALGWTQQQVIEAVHIVGFFEYVNRVADGLGLQTRGKDSPMLLEHLHTDPARWSSTGGEAGAY